MSGFQFNWPTCLLSGICRPAIWIGEVRVKSGIGKELTDGIDQ